MTPEQELEARESLLAHYKEIEQRESEPLDARQFARKRWEWNLIRTGELLWKKQNPTLKACMTTQAPSA